MWLGKRRERETHCQEEGPAAASQGQGPSLYLLWAGSTAGCEGGLRDAGGGGEGTHWPSSDGTLRNTHRTGNIKRVPRAQSPRGSPAFTPTQHHYSTEGKRRHTAQSKQPVLPSCLLGHPSIPAGALLLLAATLISSSPGAGCLIPHTVITGITHTRHPQLGLGAGAAEQPGSPCQHHSRHPSAGSLVLCIPNVPLGETQGSMVLPHFPLHKGTIAEQALLGTPRRLPVALDIVSSTPSWSSSPVGCLLCF